MAAHLSVSLSESVQASLILQHQEGRLLSSRQKSHHRINRSSSILSSDDSSEASTKRQLPFFLQCLIVTVFAGMEMNATFTLIYTILFLQFLGVPTSLVTIEGIIAGCVSIVFLPITGYFADRGSNLVTRKMKMLFISLGMHAAGMAGVAICSVLRFNTDNAYPGNSTHQLNITTTVPTLIQDIIGNHSQPPLSSSSSSSSPLSHVSDNQSDHLFVSESILKSHDYHQSHISDMVDIHAALKHTSASGNAMGTVQIVGIFSAALLDAGFAMGTTLCRAYVLEVSPQPIHDRLLILATVFSSLGGLTLAAVGTVNFPDILGSAFSVDGTAATVFMLSCSIFTFEIVGYVCTMVTGHVVHRRNQKREDEKTLGGEGIIGYTQSDRFTRSNSFAKSSLPSVIEDSVDLNEPLVRKNSANKNNYSAVSPVMPIEELEERPLYHNMDGFDRHQYQRILAPWDHSSTSNAFLENKPLELTPSSSPMSPQDNYERDDDDDEDDDYMKINGDDDDDDDDDDSTIIDVSDKGSLTDGDEDDNDILILDHASNPGDDHHHHHHHHHHHLGDYDSFEHDSQSGIEISNVFETMRASYSMSMSFVQSAIQSYAQNWQSVTISKPIIHPEQTQQQPASNGPSIWKCKRLRFLLVSIFFAFGAHLCFANYSGNTLNIGVYHGDPTAPEGTVERANYNKGLRSAALGILIMYSGYSLICLLNKHVVDFIGEKAYFITCQTACIMAYVAFIVVQMEELYYALCMVSGIHRGCAFTLSYIMVTKLVKEQQTSQNGTGNMPTNNIGQVMAVIGFLLPCEYVMLSSMIGPLMAALDSVWVPMVVGTIESGLALLAFFLFLCTKD